MNAADVLAEMGYRPQQWRDDIVAALLAHGEQGEGVTIEADGDLHPKDPPMTTRLPDGTLWALAWVDDATIDYEDASTSLYRLLPLSAEAGDTE
jgi:hypothetical protein